MKISINFELESEKDMKRVERFMRADDLHLVLDKILNEILIDETKMDHKVKAQDLMDELRDRINSIIKELRIELRQ